MAAKRSLETRLTTKLGPLPVWAWAAVILGLYYAYTKLGKSSPAAAPVSAPTTTDPNQTPVSADTSVPASSGGGGSPSSNLNDTLLSQLSGFQSSIDQLTAAVQTTAAFDNPGSSGSIPWGNQPITGLIPGTPGGTVNPNVSPPPYASSTPAGQKPAPVVRKAAPVRYYTYKKNVPLNRGQTLHFTKGKGYYAA